MIQIVEKKACCGCGACYNICPQKCISMVKDEEGFLYPKVDQDACVKCNLCNLVCPFGAACNKKKSEPSTYAVINSNRSVRENSSSGGFFSILMDYVFGLGGVVYGASFSDDFKACSHVRVTEPNNSFKLRGSKYVQSIVGDSYRKAKIDLDNGKTVLFSGTPCQINGLKKYLRKDYRNLVTVDVICHGVPSPFLWEEYVIDLEKRYHSSLEHFSFRDKKYGWQNFGIRKKTNRVDRFHYQFEDPYMAMFLKNYCLRPSCYSCLPKTGDPMSDFTIGDFWGIRNVLPDFDDDLGVSIVMLHTEAARSIFDLIKAKAFYKEVNYQKSIANNVSYYQSAKRPKEREAFYSDLDAIGFKKLRKKYWKVSLKDRLKCIVKRTRFWRLISAKRRSS